MTGISAPPAQTADLAASARPASVSLGDLTSSGLSPDVLPVMDEYQHSRIDVTAMTTAISSSEIE